MTPDSMGQLVSHALRDPLTEAEARKIGHAAQRIAQLRDLLKLCVGGSICVATNNGSQSVAFYKNDIAACLALLIEREGQLLSSFGVILSETPS